MKPEAKASVERWFSLSDNERREKGLPVSKRGIAKREGVTFVTVNTWEKAWRENRSEAPEYSEMAQVESQLKTLLDKGNATAGRVWLDLQKYNDERNERKGDNELTAEELTRCILEAEGKLIEEGYRVESVQAESSLLSK